jgi:hypothetical protein
MGHQLTLELPDEVYGSLRQRAEQTGQTPETVAAEWLKTTAERLSDDPLLQLAGVLESTLTDTSERHDQYIGDGLLMGMRKAENE